MPLVQRFFFFFWKNFLFFWEIFGNLEFFFLNLKIYIYIYIHEQSTSNATWIFRIQRNIEIGNKQKNFKLNHDVTNQMWSEAKLGRLLLLGPLRMLKTWWAWTLIMIFWYLLEMAWVCTWKAWALIMNFRYLLEMAWTLIMIFWKAWTLHLEGMYLVNFWPLMLIMRIHLWWAQVLGLEWFKKQFLVSIPSRIQSQAFGL